VGRSKPEERVSVNFQTLAAAQTDAGLRESLQLLDLPEPWVIVLVVAPALATLVWIGYRGESLSTPARATLSILRATALMLLLAVLARPVKVLQREEVQKAIALVLVDDSASMQRKDAYVGDAATRSALAELGIAEPAQATRSGVAQNVLDRVVLPKLEAGGYTTKLFAFASELSPIGASSALTGRGNSTRLGDALLQALSSHRGRHVTDVLVLSDGRQNAGSSLSDAARAAAAVGVNVHTLVLGDTRPERNLALELVEAPASALEGDEIAITVRVVARGVERGVRGDVRLEEYDPEDPDGRALRVAASAEIELSENGERTTLVARSGPANRRTQERRFRVEIAPISGETSLEDNVLQVGVHVSPQKVRVLYVEGYPRWEYRRLALDMLKRADENIQFQAFLLSANPDFRQESSKDLPALTRVPVDRKELLDNYDVVILGDVNPFAVSPDPGAGEEFMKALVEFVERGGGLCAIAGEYDLPRAYVGTPIETLLPVLFDEAELRGGPSDTTRRYRPRLEDPDHPHEIVRLHSDLAVNRELWEEESGLWGMHWFSPVSRAKPGAQVLLRHPRESNSYGAYPLAVAGYYPSGRTLFLAFDETWTFRFHWGPRFHERFWRNAIRWLALGRLRSGDRRYRLELARSSYDLGARVAVEARVLDEDYRPSQAQTQEIRWSAPEGQPQTLVLTAVEGRPGMFRGALDPDRTGLHRVWIERDSERISSAEFEVVIPSLESADPTPAPTVLVELSAATGGRAVDLARLSELWRQDLAGGEERRDPISARLDDIWDHWGALLLVLAVLSAEWILRKRYQLV
jgi:uncharacterized membrane protein